MKTLAYVMLFVFIFASGYAMGETFGAPAALGLGVLALGAWLLLDNA